MLKELNEALSGEQADDEMNASLERYMGLQNAKLELAKQLSYVIL